ncbi:MAG: hypothetical protein U5N86_02340 [Planctomycetota bacterium]|nr:hypothetical protein [Planctomycetota bacterium]
MFDNIIPGSSEEGRSKPSKFFADFAKPLAAVLAVLILIGASYYVYNGFQQEAIKSATKQLREAKTVEDLRNPTLVDAVKDTPLEFEWHLNLLEKLKTNRKSGTDILDLEGFIEEAEKFIAKYPRKGATYNIMFVLSTFYAFKGELDKSKELLRKIVESPQTENLFIRTRAKEELAILNDPSTDNELDDRFENALKEFALYREEKAKPSPSPSPSVAPSAEPTVLPTEEPAASPSPSAPIVLDEPDASPEPSENGGEEPENPAPDGE